MTRKRSKEVHGGNKRGERRGRNAMQNGVPSKRSRGGKKGHSYRFGSSLKKLCKHVPRQRTIKLDTRRQEEKAKPGRPSMRSLALGKALRGGGGGGGGKRAVS